MQYVQFLSKILHNLIFILRKSCPERGSDYSFMSLVKLFYKSNVSFMLENLGLFYYCVTL